MIKKGFICILFFISINGLFAQTNKNELINSFSIGLDLVGLSYDQFLVYFEKPLTEKISADFAIGYSPGGLWKSTFKYWYFQADIRNYLLNNESKDLYTGFGVSIYLTKDLLDFSRWNIQPGYQSSSVVALAATIGWKHYFTGNTGFYIDPNIFVYNFSPLSLVTTDSKEVSTFEYKPFSILANAIIGYSF